MRSWVIYYGSTRSTLNTPPKEKYQLSAPPLVTRFHHFSIKPYRKLTFNSSKNHLNLTFHLENKVFARIPTLSNIPFPPEVAVINRDSDSQYASSSHSHNLNFVLLTVQGTSLPSLHLVPSSKEVAEATDATRCQYESI